MQRPMTELFTSPAETRGRMLSRTISGFTNISEVGYLESEAIGHSNLSVTGTGAGRLNVKVMGHPCAAGCGHYCWASSETYSAN